MNNRNKGKVYERKAYCSRMIRDVLDQVAGEGKPENWDLCMTHKALIEKSMSFTKEKMYQEGFGHEFETEIAQALNDYTKSILEALETQKDYIKRMSPNTRFSTYPYNKSKEEGWSIGYETGVSDAISKIEELQK